MTSQPNSAGSCLYAGGHFDPFLGETLELMSADQIAFLRRHLGVATPA
jgi:hypothetical protein